jgi:hypothetical protein
MIQNEEDSGEKGITVNTRELDEAWEKGDRAEEIFYELKEKILEFPKWLTNTSLALLGFYLALLIQLKLSDYEVESFTTLIPLISLTFAVSIGFFIKFRYQFRKTVLKTFEMSNEFVGLLRILDNKFVGKGADLGITEEKEELFSEITDLYEELKSKVSDVSADLILIQFWLLAVSLTYIMAYLVRFLLE